jgi:hypothetical protein
MARATDKKDSLVYILTQLANPELFADGPLAAKVLVPFFVEFVNLIVPERIGWGRRLREWTMQDA